MDGTVAEVMIDQTRAFRDALGSYPTGVTIVTCHSDEGPMGITANSFASLSLDPPLILWSPAKASRRYLPFVEARHFCVHVLDIAQRDLCRRFSVSAFDFDGLDYNKTTEGVPRLSDALAIFECAAHAQHDGGDHTIVVGQVLSFETAKHGAPLVFAQGQYGRFVGAP